MPPSGPPPRRRRSPAAIVVTLAVVGAVGVFAAFLVVNAVLLKSAPPPPDCGELALPTAARWQALDGAGQEDLAGDLELCSKLTGRTPAEIAVALGPPTATGRNGDGSALLQYDMANGRSSTGAQLSPDRLLLNLGPDGRVASTRIDRVDYSVP